MEVMRAAEERELAGGDVLHLEVGQPSTPAPRRVIEAAHRALDEDVLGYTTAGGHPALRARVAQHYREWYDVDVDPGAVMFSVGASGAFVAASWPPSMWGIESCRHRATRVIAMRLTRMRSGGPSGDDGDSSNRPPSFSMVSWPMAAHRWTRALVPVEPEWNHARQVRMAEITDWCREHGVWFVSDEIYHGLTYGESAPTALQFDPHAIVINSFSKYFSMTGWRLGWLIMPDPLREALTRIGQNVTISAPTLSQLAAVVAFDCHDDCEAYVARYAENRDIVLDGLRAAGFDDLAPADGAFYVWACIDHLIESGRTTDSQALCTEWLNILGLAATPGVDFDPTRGHRYVRFSFAGSTRDCVNAIRRLLEWV